MTRLLALLCAGASFASIERRGIQLRQVLPSHLQGNTDALRRTRDVPQRHQARPERCVTYSPSRRFCLARQPALHHRNAIRSCASTTQVTTVAGAPPSRRKLSKRIVTGWLLAFAGTAVIFSGDVVYTLVLVLVAMLAQHEYFNTVMETGVKPARRISFAASLAMYACACKFPMQHQLGLPLGFAAVVMWFLVMRPKPGSIADISTTLMGLVYTGLMPSYWARLRCMKDGLGVSQGLIQNVDCAARWISPLPVAADVVTQGAITYWFTALGCALSDVGAYFGGKKMGRHKISEVIPAAGGASPNKTVEGFLSGATMAMITAIVGAKIMGWPYWGFTGVMYGLLISVISLVGDLMASMLKRDAGVKDFGSVFPGHGGILDRLDSYIFVGPSAFAFVTLFLPFVERMGVAASSAAVLGGFTSVAVMCAISRRDFWSEMRNRAFNRHDDVPPVHAVNDKEPPDSPEPALEMEDDGRL